MYSFSPPIKGLQIALNTQNPRDIQTRFGFGLVRVPRPKTEPEKSEFQVATDSLNQDRGICFFSRNFGCFLKFLRYSDSVRFWFGPTSKTVNRTRKIWFPSCYRILKPRPSRVLKSTTRRPLPPMSTAHALKEWTSMAGQARVDKYSANPPHRSHPLTSDHVCHSNTVCTRDRDVSCSKKNELSFS